MSALLKLRKALAYARFSNAELRAAHKKFIAALEADLTSLGYEPSAAVESAVEGLEAAMTAADEEQEQIQEEIKAVEAEDDNSQ